MNGMVSAVMLFVFIGASSLSATDGGVHSYTDDDLAGYARPGDDAAPAETVHPAPATARKSRRATTVRRTDEEKRRQYWCREGSRYRNRYDDAAARLKEAEQLLSERERDYAVRKISSCALTAARDNVAASKSNLARADRELRDIENEAHRQWVPPGWLRCQFE